MEIFPNNQGETHAKLSPSTFSPSDELQPYVRSPSVEWSITRLSLLCVYAHVRNVNKCKLIDKFSSVARSPNDSPPNNVYDDVAWMRLIEDAEFN